MSRVQAVMVRRHPVVNNVHDIAAIEAHIIEDAKEIEMLAEAAGMGLYRLVPPEPFLEHDGGMGADLE